MIYKLLLEISLGHTTSDEMPANDPDIHTAINPLD